jgi:integrase
MSTQIFTLSDCNYRHVQDVIGMLTPTMQAINPDAMPNPQLALHAITTAAIRESYLFIGQSKTKKKLRMEVSGEPKAVIDRTRARKAGYKVVSTALVVNQWGRRMTLEALRKRFSGAREKAEIGTDEFKFRDLRAKAGTDKTDATGDIEQVPKQLGHDSIGMTEHDARKRRGDKVGPTR